MAETWGCHQRSPALSPSCRLAGSHQLTCKYAALAIVLNVHISSCQSQNVHWSLGTGQIPQAQEVLWLIPIHVIYSLNCWFSRPTFSVSCQSAVWHVIPFRASDQSKTYCCFWSLDKTTCMNFPNICLVIGWIILVKSYLYLVTMGWWQFS